MLGVLSSGTGLTILAMPEAQGNGIPIEEAKIMAGMAKAIHDVASTLLFVAAEFKKTSACMYEHKIRCDLEITLELAEDRATECLDQIVDEENLFRSAEAHAIAWFMSVNQATIWLRAVLSCVGVLRKLVLGQAVLDMTGLAQRVEKHTPSYDHICNNTGARRGVSCTLA